MHTGIRRATRSAVALVAALLLGACYPTTTLTDESSDSACPEGTYNVSSQLISGSFTTPLGTVELTPLSGSLTLTIDATSWTLSGSQTLEISGTTIYGTIDGTATITLEASGTWTQTSSTELSFTLTDISGSGTFEGTINGIPVSTSVSLDDVGADDLYGLTGTATFSCGTNTLTLTFTSLHMELQS